LTTEDEDDAEITLIENGKYPSSRNTQANLALADDENGKEISIFL